MFFILLLRNVLSYKSNARYESSSCTFDPTEAIEYVAVGSKVYKDSENCGMCIEARNGYKSTIAKIVDKCVGCKEYDIVLGPVSFEKLMDTNSEDGVLNIEWDFVNCENKKPIQLQFMEGSSPWWLSFIVKNNDAVIKKVEIKNNKGKLIKAKRNKNNIFTAKNAGYGPYNIVLVSDKNESILSENVPLSNNGGIFNTTAQFKKISFNKVNDDNFRIIPIGQKNSKGSRRIIL